MKKLVMGALVALSLVLAAQADEVIVTPDNRQGWIPDDMRAGGTASETTTYPRDGTGSLELQTHSPADKASFGLYWNPIGSNSFGTTTTIGNLSLFSFDWFRSSSSTSVASYTPALRFYFLNDADGDGLFDPNTSETFGSFVWEFAYQEQGSTAPTDQWLTANFMTSDVWQRANSQTGSGGTNLDGNVGGVDGTNLTIPEWLDPTVPKPAGSWQVNNNTLITGVTVSLGSGVGGDSHMAVDNISMGYSGGQTKAYNFEQVPEPGSASLLLCGMVALGARRFRKG